MIRRLGLLGILLLVALPLAAGADTVFDGKKPLICSLDDTVDCTDAKDECNQGDAVSVNAPDLIRIDFKKKEVRALSGQESGDNVARIRHKERTNERLVVQGAQEGRGWSIVIVDGTGAATIAVAGNDHGFLIFGTCTEDD